MLRCNADWVAVGRRLRLIRKEHGLSQRAFGRRFGISQNMISLYEKGRSRSSVDFYMCVAEFGGKSIEWLLTGRGDHVEATLREMRDLHENMKTHLGTVRRLLDPETSTASQQEILAVTDPDQLREILLDETNVPECVRGVLSDPARWKELAMTGREFCALQALVQLFGQMSQQGLRLFLRLVRSEMGRHPEGVSHAQFDPGMGRTDEERALEPGAS